ncbi:MAG: RecX family transcriptional regulator [Bacteroidales bacterium]|nr:RecX family transcriptional regulator [Bacteroidales bacterium]
MNDGKAPDRETELKWALARMQALCSRREYCSADIRRKLLHLRDHPLLPEEAEQILAELVKEKYLDDARYAGAFARDKAALTAWGMAKIRYALRAKGISDEDITRALESIEPERSEERLRKLLASRWRGLSGDPKAKQKLLRLGLSRGYGYDEVLNQLETICQITEP